MCEPRSGMPRPQLSSCFLVCMKSDSIEGIYDTLKECAAISKSAGGRHENAVHAVCIWHMKLKLLNDTNTPSTALRL